MTVNSDDFYQELKEFLEFPENVREIEIKLSVGQPVVITASYNPSINPDDRNRRKCFKKYELKEIQPKG